MCKFVFSSLLSMDCILTLYIFFLILARKLQSFASAGTADNSLAAV